ncbi:MAG: alanine--glyoxylate aminotransferase family protein [Acidimicrobiia bacterium]
MNQLPYDPVGGLDPEVPPAAHLPARLLCGPGPSNVSSRVLDALARPITGHLDPAFLAVVDAVSAMLRLVFGTDNPVTFAVSGTGSAAMEAAFVNVLEAGDTAVVCVNGLFGERMCEVARRCGAEVVRVDAGWGNPVDADAVAATLTRHRDARLLSFVHAETSTGAWTDAAAVCAAAASVAPEVLVVADTVTSLAGIAVEVDTWGVDVCYSGTQKCLSVPPGLAPITFGARAVERIGTRTTPVQSWYLDVSLISGYLEERAYHHTAPVSMLVGLHEGLRVVIEEGLEARHDRHMAAGSRLQAVLEDRGYDLFAHAGSRLPQLTTALVPAGVDAAEVRRRLLMERNLEIGAGVGEHASRMWRIGLMGENATDAVVDVILDALP